MEQLQLFKISDETIEDLNEAMKIAGQISHELWLLHLDSMDFMADEEMVE